MTGFIVGGPPESLEQAEDFYRELDGLLDIRKHQPQIWFLIFETREQAQTAQWILSINGAEGTSHDELPMRREDEDD